MGRVVTYWIVLGTIAVVTTNVVGLLVFREISFTFVQFASLVCAPLIQAAVVAWRTERPAAAVADLGWRVLRHPLAQPVLALDGLVLGAGVAAWDTHVIGLGAAVNLHTTWTLAKAVAAAAFCVGAVLRAPRRERPAMARHIAAPLILIFALDPSASWLAAGFARVRSALGPQMEIVQRLVFYGSLFSMLIVLTLRSARALKGRSHEAGSLLHAAVAAALVVAVAVMLATFNLAVVTQPWLGIATLAASAAATGVLLAALFLATADTGAPRSSR